MATEHEHRWESFLDTDGVVEERCTIPGCKVSRRSMLPKSRSVTLERSKLEALEQQLVQTQAENERLRRRDAEWTESQAYAVTRYAQARALLEEMERRLAFAEEDWPDIPLSSFLPQADEWRVKVHAFLAEPKG